MTKIINVDQYYLLVDREFKKFLAPVKITKWNGKLAVWDGHLTHALILAHRPIGDAPKLEGVPVMPKKPKLLVSMSHHDTYTGIEDMKGNPIFKGSKVKIHDYKTFEGIVVWENGSYRIKGTWCAYNVYAWRNNIEVISSPELPKQEGVPELPKIPDPVWEKAWKIAEQTGIKDEQQLIYIATAWYDGFKEASQGRMYSEEEMNNYYHRRRDFEHLGSELAHTEAMDYVNKSLSPTQEGEPEWEFEPEMETKCYCGHTDWCDCGQDNDKPFVQRLKIINNIVQGKWIKK